MANSAPRQISTRIHLFHELHHIQVSHLSFFLIAPIWAGSTPLSPYLKSLPQGPDTCFASTAQPPVTTSFSSLSTPPISSSTQYFPSKQHHVPNHLLDLPHLPPQMALPNRPLRPRHEPPLLRLPSHNPRALGTGYVLPCL